MRIAVCEDNEVTAEKIAEVVKETMDRFSVESTVDIYYLGEDFEKSGISYDLIFLDCRLPDSNGIDIGKRLRENDDEAAIIFITAYDEYVYDSFEVGAFRYLLKPIKKDTIVKSIDSFIRTYKKNLFIDVPTSHKSHIIKVNEIMYIEANDKRSIVRLIGRTLDSTKSIADFQDELTSPSFFRTHRRFLLNMRYIADVDKNIVTLTNGEKVEISRRNLGDFNKNYINYLKYSIRNGK